MFKVVILGTDINAYYMARNFHEEYHIKPHIIGKTKMMFTSFSNILTYELDYNLWNKDVFCNKLEEYALKNKKDKLVLVPTNDHYVRLLVENKEFLSKYYLFNCPSLEIINNLLIKDNFYNKYKDYDLDMPLTYIYDCKTELNLQDFENFMYPIIIKPGNGVNYYEHPFEDQAKVYKVSDLNELKDVVNVIKNSGYTDKLIIQEFIPGDDSMLFDSIFYFNKDAEPELMSFAQIALQEHTKTGIGNCTVLVNGYNEFNNTSIIKDKLQKFLLDIGYTGFAEFDLKYDVRDNKFKVFEINPRQARSSYYLTACGYNLAKYLIDDLINNEKHEFKLIEDKMVLSFVPLKVIKKYVYNVNLKNEIFKLIKEGKFVRPLRYKKDRNFKRKLWLIYRDYNYIKKYKQNNW